MAFSYAVIRPGRWRRFPGSTKAYFRPLLAGPIGGIRSSLGGLIVSAAFARPVQGGGWFAWPTQFNNVTY